MLTEVLAHALDKQFPQVKSEHQASCHLLGCAHLALMRTGREKSRPPVPGDGALRAVVPAATGKGSQLDSTPSARAG